MAKRPRPRKKKPTRLPETASLEELFGQASALKKSFAEEVDDHLTPDALDQALAETKGRRARPVTLQERLRHYPPPGEELDLHGTTGAEAAARVIGFLNSAAGLKHRTVRIITGKGLHSEGPAVLPPVVEATLAELKRTGRILHYAWDKKIRERSGAVLVYLK